MTPVHDGPVQEISKNPFMPHLLMSVGGYSFAVWNEGVMVIYIVCKSLCITLIILFLAILYYSFSTRLQFTFNCRIDRSFYILQVASNLLLPHGLIRSRTEYFSQLKKETSKSGISLKEDQSPYKSKILQEVQSMVKK